MHTITAVAYISQHQPHTPKLLLFTAYYNSFEPYTTAMSMCYNTTTIRHITHSQLKTVYHNIKFALQHDYDSSSNLSSQQQLQIVCTSAMDCIPHQTSHQQLQAVYCCKCQISACRKYITTDSAQSHIYGQAHTVLHKTSHQQLQAVCYVDNEMHTTSNLSPHK